MIVCPKVGRVALLDKLFRLAQGAEEDLSIGLFKNDTVPDVNTVGEDLIPCVFDGYSIRTFDRSTNGAAALSGTQAQMLLSGGMLEWECTASPETIYGWFLVDATPTLLLVERYDVPHVLIAGSIHRLYPYVNLGKIVAD